METRAAKQIARLWVERNRGQWPGLRAAHLVGSITTLPDTAHFPPHKDVDVHLIFDDASPMLTPSGPFPTMIETEYRGLLIEAGLKPVTDYRSAEAVLANPEIAHHLTVESVLFDPSGLLNALQGPVRRGYGRRQWVTARLAYEREGLARALALLPMARAMPGDPRSKEAMILGYTSTFITAALCVAALQSPSTGAGGILRAREVLAERGRLDLYEALLAALGVDRLEPARVAAYLAEGIEAFDLAVSVRRSPHPFQHKLHAHLRPYFVESCRSLLAEGRHREALRWLTPFFHASTDVILTDGPEDVKPRFAERHDRFLADLGLGTDEGRADHFAAAERVYRAIFELTDAIVAQRADVAA